MVGGRVLTCFGRDLFITIKARAAMNFESQFERISRAAGRICRAGNLIQNRAVGLLLANCSYCPIWEVS
jgi:hypothetical protein